MSSLDVLQGAEDPQPAVVDTHRLSWSPGAAPWLAIVLFVAAHAVYALISDFNPPPVATLHAVGTLAIAVWLVGVRRNPEAVACVAAYIAASDVLWRMTEAAVPWEVCKLSLIVIFVVATLRIVRRPRRLGLPILLLMLLAPSAVVTIERFGLLGNGRERLSFELAAHVALVAGVIFFSNLRTDRQTFAGVLWMTVGPILAVNTIATAGTLGLEEESFSGSVSSFASSGGYGPNQVSALIGVGALVCTLLVFIDRRPVLRVLAGGLAFWFLAQSVLTFSRGGSLNLVVAFVAAIPFFVRTAQMVVRFFIVSGLVLAVIVFALIPVLQDITGGSFGDRFTSKNPTLRTDLMEIELETWRDNLALGVGVGMVVRTIDDEERAAEGQLPKLPTHTEYTRLLAEHGVLGLAAIFVLVALGVRAVRGQPLRAGRITAVVLVVWCASEVAHASTRLAMVPFAFALAALRVEAAPVVDPEPRPEPVPA